MDSHLSSCILYFLLFVAGVKPLNGPALETNVRRTVVVVYGVWRKGEVEGS
jgi:hypothetical protein